MFKAARVAKGTRCTPLTLKLLQVSDPLRPAFEIDRLMLRMWDMLPEGDNVEVELPAPIPIPQEELARPAFQPEEAQPVTFTAEQLRSYHKDAVDMGKMVLAGKLADQIAALEAPPQPPDPPTPPPGNGPDRMTPTSQKAIDALRNRGVRVDDPPPSGPVELDAALGKVLADADQVATRGPAEIINGVYRATVPFLKNGHHKAGKGGGQ